MEEVEEEDKGRIRSRGRGNIRPRDNNFFKSAQMNNNFISKNNDRKEMHIEGIIID